MIELRNVVKAFGARLALDRVSFRVEPGRVTAFLGPNGSGKTTTMRLLLGLDRPTSGLALIAGVEYRRMRRPLFQVGALLDARSAHPGRTAYQHLRALSLTHGIPAGRVDDVLSDVGLSEVADRRVGGFSLGMRQRLGIAAALLGDPATLIFDEPVNGLDPDGVLWFRDLVRSLAAEGRTVFLSSHLISEVALTADQVLVLGRGRLLADAPVGELGGLVGNVSTVLVRAAEATRLAAALTRSGAAVDRHGDALRVTGLDATAVGEIALREGLALHELRLEEASLEDAYRRLTDAAVEYSARA